MTVTTRLRAGVIGLGVGMHHAHAFHAHPSIDFTACCDIQSGLHVKLCEQLGVNANDVHFYTDHQEMLASERLDLVGVATPDALHLAPVVNAAEAGVRGVLCEKPIASSIADAERMIAVAKTCGAVLLIDHTRNFDPAFTMVRERVEAGGIGTLTRIVAILGGRRAMLFRNHTHLLGAVRAFAGAPPSWVFAALDDGFSDYGLEYRGEGGRDPDLDPGATMAIGFENGVRALVMASKRTPATGVELDLLGTRGRIIVSDSATRFWTSEQDEGPLQEVPVTWAQGVSGSLGDRLKPAVNHLVDLVSHGGRSLSPPEEARDVLRIIFGALQSQAEGMIPIHFGR